MWAAWIKIYIKQRQWWEQKLIIAGNRRSWLTSQHAVGVVKAGDVTGYAGLITQHRGDFGDAQCDGSGPRRFPGIV